MRITNNMSVNSLLENLQRNINKMSKYQDQLSTGKAIQAASDDPIIASKVLRYKADLSDLEQYGDNTSDALSWMEVTESSISDVKSVLQRVRELTVSGATGTNSQTETDQMAKEIEQLRNQLLTDGNMSFAGLYIFSGTQTDKPLFNTDGTFAIQVTTEDVRNPQKSYYQIGSKETIDVSSHGVEVFGVQRMDDGITTAMITGFPDGKSTDGVAATRAELAGGSAVDFTKDLSGGVGDGTIDVVITTVAPAASTTYKIPSTVLSCFNGTENTADKKNLLDIVKNADSVPPGTKLSSAADVMLDASGKLVIRAQDYGTNSTVAIAYHGDSGAGPTAAQMAAAIGIPDATSDTGTNVVNASVSGNLTYPITETDIQTRETDPTSTLKFSGQKFSVTLNGVTKTVTVGTLATPVTPAAPPAPTTWQESYQNAVNAGLTTAYGSPAPLTATMTIPGGQLTLTTANQLSDGKTPSLEVHPVVSSESSLIHDIDTLIKAMHSNDKTTMDTMLGKLDVHLNRVLSTQADVGVRTNRMELVANRIDDNNISFTKMLSTAEDVDMSQIIMYLKNSENVYQAALSTGARVIQKSLVDFIQ